MQTIQQNCVWQIGNGKSINFWRDKWLSNSIADLIHIPEHRVASLEAKVADFIRGKSWSIPDYRRINFPLVAAEIDQMPIPILPFEDQLIWTGTDSGCLSFKEAFNYLKPLQNSVNWSKIIWSYSIPPSRSFVA